MPVQFSLIKLLEWVREGCRKAVSLKTPALEVGGETKIVAARGANGVAGEEAAEVDDVKNIIKVLSVVLECDNHVVGLVNICARRGIDLERGIDSASGKVDAIQDLLAVFREHRGRIAVELEGEPGGVLNSARDPESRGELVANASTNRVALILRIGEMAAELRFRLGGVVTQKKAARHR